MLRTQAQNTYRQYERQLVWRVILPASAALLVLALVSLLIIYTNTSSELRKNHADTLSQLSAGLDAQIENLTDNVAGHAESISGAFFSPDNVTAELIDLINDHLDDYSAARFIDSQGQILAEIINQNNITVEMNVERGRFAPGEKAQADAMQAPLGEVFMGKVRLQTDASGNPAAPLTTIFSLYSPVWGHDGNFLGLLMADLLTSEMFDLIENASASRNGRQIILQHEDRFIALDTGASNNFYQQNLLIEGGNAALDGFYSDLVQTVAENEREFNALSAGTKILSAQPIPFSEVQSASWSLILIDDIFSAFNTVFALLILNLTLAGILIALMIWSVRRLARPMLSSLTLPNVMMQRIRAGELNLAQEIWAEEASGENIEGVLEIAGKLQELDRSISQERSRRLRDMQVAGRIGREIATLYDIDQLLARAINLICTEFGHYHAQVFLLDDVGRQAILVKSRGDAGQRLIEFNHKIAVGSASVVGMSTKSRQPVVVNDTLDPKSGPHMPNPMLPDTRAEMSVPLIIGETVIGALDIQSRQPGVFHTDDLPTYRLLADQLAVAIHTARTITESEKRYKQIITLNQRLTREAWQSAGEDFEVERDYVYNLVEVKPDRPGDGQTGLSAPIRIRDEVIGTIETAMPDGKTFTEGDQMMLGAIAERVALAIENRRLFLEAEGERQNLNAILSTMPVGVIVLDPQTRKPVQFNQRAQELLGREIDHDLPFTAENYNLYRTGTNLLYPNEEMPVEVALMTGNAVSGDDLAVSTARVHVDLLLNAAPIRDRRGGIAQLIVAFQDISNLRNLENTLQENLRETVSLYEAQRALSEAGTLDEVLDTTIGQLALSQPAEGYLLLYDEASSRLNGARALAQPLSRIDSLVELFDTAAVIDLRDIENDLDSDSVARYELANMGLKSLLAVPLHSQLRETRIGWMVMADYKVDAFNPDQERFLTTLADMASIAIENRFLLTRVQVSLQEATDLYNATTSISRSRDLSELSTALEQALSDLGADMIAVYVYDAQKQPTELFQRGFDDPADAMRLMRHDVPFTEAMFVRSLAQTTLGPLEREMLKLGYIHSFAAVSLRAKEASSGRILIAYRKEHLFVETETRYLNALANNTSVILDNQLLLEQIQSSLQEASVLYQASRALTYASSPKDILDAAVQHLIEPHVSLVFIATLTSADWNSPGAAAQIEASWHETDEMDLRGELLTVDRFAGWEKLSSADVIIIDDIYNDHNELDRMERVAFESLESRSIAIIPLRVPKRSIGAIWIGAKQAHRYTDKDERVFRAFSEQASLSLEAAFLLRQTERRARQLETSAVVGRRAGQILDLDVLLPELVNLIRDQFAYDHVQIFLMDENDEYAILRASTGQAGAELLAIRHQLTRGSDSVIGKVTETGQPVIALDTAGADVVHKPNPHLPLTRSEMALPFIIKNQIIGALDVQSNQPNAFNEEDIRALTTLAAQIANAIDNARLYEETQRRASDMTFLFDVATVAAASQTLEESLQNVAERLYDSLNPSCVAIYLPQLYEDVNEAQFYMMRAVAVAGLRQPLSEISEVRMDDSENIVGIVSSTLQPVIIPNVQSDVRYMSISPSARSAIVMPINSGYQIVGVIAMESDRQGAFDHDTLQLMLTMSGSLSAIIQNARLVEQLQKSNEQLREVDRLKSEFLANMSHELRTPLNSIIGFSRVMLKGIDGPLTEMQEQDLSTIYNSGQHLLVLINDILDQAKIAANKMELKLVFFDVRPMIESVKSIAIGLVKEKSVDLRVEIAPNLPQAYADEFRTRQILLNLVNNAAKFTPEGSVTIRTYLNETDDGGQFIRIDVIDTGIGIAEQDIPLLFEAFRQVDSSLTRTAGGTGLGLPIARSLAEMQGGALTVTSELNVGSTFTVLIPIEPGADSEAEKSDTQPHPIDITPTTAPDNGTSTARMGPGMTQVIPRVPPGGINLAKAMPKHRLVLLIEDNKDMVDQFRRALQREGFDVQTADHPSYAEAMAGNLQPMVIILDVNFGDGKGWDILDHLKTREDTLDIPVVVVTLNNDSRRAFDLGAHSFVQRPFMPEQLTKVIKDAEYQSSRDRILIIDDDEESIRLIQQVLSETGHYRVFSAQNGREGIVMVARRHPDLIILDLRMPDMDGFAVLKELRSNAETANIPILIVTGDTALSQDEMQQLADIQVLQKSEITQDENDGFIETIEHHLTRLN